MLGYPLEIWPVFCICAFIVALNKTGVPGIGMLAVTLMASAMDAKKSVGFLLPILIMGVYLWIARLRHDRAAARTGALHGASLVMESAE